MRPRATHQPIAGRTSLIHHPRRHRNVHQPPKQLVRAPDRSPGSHLARSLIKHSDRRLARVHIKTDPTDTVNHVGTSYLGCGPRAEAFTLEREQTPAYTGVPTQHR